MKPSSLFACLFLRSLHYKMLFSSAPMWKVSFVLIKLTLGTLAEGQKHCEWQTDSLDMDFDLLLVKMMIRYHREEKRKRGKEEGDSQERQYGRKDEWW